MYFKLESNTAPNRITFSTLQCRLILLLQRKLDDGEFTERGLARLTGISQPQVHHLLKGKRRLSPETADVFLEAVHLTVLDLFTDSEVTGLTPASAIGVRHLDRKNPALTLTCLSA